jgi:hypothetical protein
MKDVAGPTERDLLDNFNNVISMNGLPVSEEMQDNLDRSFGEYLTEGTASLAGIIVPFSLAGKGVNTLRTIGRFEKIYAGWRGGKIALWLLVLQISPMLLPKLGP